MLETNRRGHQEWKYMPTLGTQQTGRRQTQHKKTTQKTKR